MAGNRKHGFLRGNANGRNGSAASAAWFCSGCARDHGGRVERTGYRGGDYCDRTYLQLTEKEFAAQRQAILHRP